MAMRTYRRMLQGAPVVTTFLFDDSLPLRDNDIKIKIFKGYSVEWAEFVLANRRNKTDVPAHPYDIVIGPIANDTVGVQIQRFMRGYISIERLIEELRYHGNNAMQYYFGTQRALSLLKKE